MEGRPALEEYYGGLYFFRSNASIHRFSSLPRVFLLRIVTTRFPVLAIIIAPCSVKAYGSVSENFNFWRWSQIVTTSSYNFFGKTVFSPSQNPRLAFPPEAAAFGRGNSNRLTVAENVAGQGGVYKKRLKSQGQGR
jgi:hypothetical protein